MIITDRDWVLRAPQGAKVERIEAFFSSYAYEPHRHDVYAIGRTLSGVQNFRYQKSMRHSLPGSSMVIYPDELHDGEAGCEQGFHYRMIYVEPVLIQQILRGRPLPFIPGGISNDPRLYRAMENLLQSIDNVIDPLEEDDAIYDLAQALDCVAGQRRGRGSFDFAAAERAREYIHSHLADAVTLDALEIASGRERWSLSRDFRALYGTSPYRYVVQRRLEQCRHLMLDGFSLADAALAAGFSDQSHMTRHFTQTYGLSPARWFRMLTD
ncbi:AraC family transcriptional regulator [Affinibrenneria salicis]|uniref:AraC family transcriptional regulator n=1 Tax=Affinibrenneria salicis TaxID=2590031 RepID=A0A5J5G7P7_9GAMM|nr:AraC family transcriptional regulator [Affinibrenneria salicis]KAA9002648.1 AraC family transcriptional regulator [Affinibrenneria salicis]KAA9003064.1 AraC family transcriptional regulator [Affinibrenneria salicis]